MMSFFATFVQFATLEAVGRDARAEPLLPQFDTYCVKYGLRVPDADLQRHIEERGKYRGTLVRVYA